MDLFGRASWSRSQTNPYARFYDSGPGRQGIARHVPPCPAALHLDCLALRHGALLGFCFWSFVFLSLECLVAAEFKVRRRLKVQRAVQPLAVVKDFDVIEQSRSPLSQAGKFPFTPI